MPAYAAGVAHHRHAPRRGGPAAPTPRHRAGKPRSMRMPPGAVNERLAPQISLLEYGAVGRLDRGPSPLCSSSEEADDIRYVEWLKRGLRAYPAFAAAGLPAWWPLTSAPSAGPRRRKPKTEA